MENDEVFREDVSNLEKLLNIAEAEQKKSLLKAFELIDIQILKQSDLNQ